MGPNGLKPAAKVDLNLQMRQLRLIVARAGLAQLVEHLICNQGVADSSSATGTSFQNDFRSFANISVCVRSMCNGVTEILRLKTAAKSVPAGGTPLSRLKLIQ